MTRIDIAATRTASPRLTMGVGCGHGSEKLNFYRDALAQAGHGELRRVRVTMNDRAVCLRGEVSTFYLKQVAQEAVRPYAIGMDIRNELTVCARRPIHHFTNNANTNSGA